VKKPRRAKAQENLIKKAIEILENEVTPRFNDRRKFLKKHKIHKDTKNKYYKMFTRIIIYLDELKGNCANPIEYLIEDYLTSVYEYYKGFGKTPNLMNFSPSTNNQIQFSEWISEIERESEEGYWIYEKPKRYRIFDVSLPTGEYELNFIET